MFCRHQSIAPSPLTSAYLNLPGFAASCFGDLATSAASWKRPNYFIAKEFANWLAWLSARKCTDTTGTIAGIIKVFITRRQAGNFAFIGSKICGNIKVKICDPTFEWNVALISSAGILNVPGVNYWLTCTTSKVSDNRLLLE